jgi:hypothetical protein
MIPVTIDISALHFVLGVITSDVPDSGMLPDGPNARRLINKMLPTFENTLIGRVLEMQVMPHVSLPTVHAAPGCDSKCGCSWTPSTRDALDALAGSTGNLYVCPFGKYDGKGIKVHVECEYCLGMTIVDVYVDAGLRCETPRKDGALQQAGAAEPHRASDAQAS